MGIIDRLLPLEELPDRIRLTVSRSRPALALANRLGTELEPEQWIFIVGCYNSGTTLLHNLLAQHPDVAAFTTEGVELTDQLPRSEHFGWPRMWLACWERMTIPEGPESAERAARIKRQWSRWLPRGRRFVVEKSITNATRMPFLQAHFQPASFIHIVRNGYAVAAGIRRMADLKRFGNDQYPNQYPIELCAQQWVRSDEVIETARAGIDRFMEISYEDLAADQAGVLDAVTGFLEIPPVPKTVYADRIKVHRHWSEIRNMNADDIQLLTREEIRSIQAVAGPVLEKYGYTP